MTALNRRPERQLRRQAAGPASSGAGYCPSLNEGLRISPGDSATEIKRAVDIAYRAATKARRMNPERHAAALVAVLPITAEGPLNGSTRFASTLVDTPCLVLCSNDA